VALISLLVAFAIPAAAHAAAGDIGSKDFAFDTDGTGGFSVTGSKPESKLWYADGAWWADMAAAAGSHRIYKLDRATQTWNATTTVLDTRFKSVSDVLWDDAAKKLYVASHSNTTNSATTGTGTDGKLYQYTYAAGKYTLDAGFPVSIKSPKTEALVIAKDSTGKIWAVWNSNKKVYVNHTTSADAQSWGTPYILSGSTTMDTDDLSSVVAFGGNQIGVMFSAQNKSTSPITGNTYFAVHNDSAGDGAANWGVSAVPTGWSPDDHINLKSDSAGNVYAAVKTSESGANPLTLLLKRDTAGKWSTFIYGTGTNSHTRPIVLLDTTNNLIRMLATCPQAPAQKSGQSGGDICEKTTPLSAPANFTAGIGTAVIRDTTSANMNDVTSTKQNIAGAMGTVVLASDKDTNLYWHSDRGGSTPPPPPPPPAGVKADFTATPQTGGPGPLTVQFQDTSTGGATAWKWNFGDGSPEVTTQSPTHEFPANTTTTAIKYTVTLTASDPTKSDAGTTAMRTVTVIAPPTGQPLVFNPVADAHVKSTSPSTNYGSLATMQLRFDSNTANPTYRDYLKFNVSGTAGPVSGAKLRLFVTDASKGGATLNTVTDTTWQELQIRWTGAPALGAALGSLTTVPAGYVEIPIADGTITGDGTYSFAVSNAATDSAIFSSREGANKPELVLPG
jgi:PKD repeat protein